MVISGSWVRIRTPETDSGNPLRALGQPRTRTRVTGVSGNPRYSSPQLRLAAPAVEQMIVLIYIGCVGPKGRARYIRSI